MNYSRKLQYRYNNKTNYNSYNIGGSTSTNKNQINYKIQMKDWYE